MKRSIKEKKIIPIFFATDDNYAKYLAVTLQSIICNSNTKDYFYKIYILETNLDKKFLPAFQSICGEFGEVEYVNVKKQIKVFQSKLSIRDYYTCATYYRLFIMEMFPQYDKAIYLDCDMIVKGDISKLYNTNITNKLVAAVADQVVLMNDQFGMYPELILNISRNRYFNAGMLVMNLDQFRKQDIYNKFINLLTVRSFPVAQDQDYLNLLCKGQVRFLPFSWNKAPTKIGLISERCVKLIHYNLGDKPWKTDNVLFGEYFWKYAKMTSFYEEILNFKNSYTDEQRLIDQKNGEHLMQLVIEENSKAIARMKEEYGRANFEGNVVRI